VAGGRWRKLSDSEAVRVGYPAVPRGTAASRTGQDQSIRIGLGRRQDIGSRRGGRGDSSCSGVRGPQRSGET